MLSAARFSCGIKFLALTLHCFSLQKVACEHITCVDVAFSFSVQVFSFGRGKTRWLCMLENVRCVYICFGVNCIGVTTA